MTPKIIPTKKNTVIVNIKAGLGNQLFQYAFGRALALRSGGELKLDITDWLTGRRTIDPYRLPFFNLVESIASDEEISALKNHYGMFTKYYQKVRIKFGLGNVGFARRFLRKKGPIYLDGYWQDERYFADYADTIRSEFTLKENLSRAAHNIADMIQNSPSSVSLHVRRGAIAKEGPSHPFWGICTPEYCLSALDRIAAKIGPNFKVFVFSDDIEIARAEMTIPYPTTYVSSPDIPDYEELVLMSMCDHNIIANSSFSWWAAWLNRNHDKIIIAPKIWARSENYHFRKIVPSSWIRI
jgi:hypothetical protein